MTKLKVIKAAKQKLKWQAHLWIWLFTLVICAFIVPFIPEKELGRVVLFELLITLSIMLHFKYEIKR